MVLRSGSSTTAVTGVGGGCVCSALDGPRLPGLRGSHTPLHRLRDRKGVLHAQRKRSEATRCPCSAQSSRYSRLSQARMTWLLDAIALLLGVHVREEAHVAIVRQLDTTAAGGGGQPQRVSALRALRRGSLHRLGIRGRGAYALHIRLPLRSWRGCATAVRLRTQVVYVPVYRQRRLGCTVVPGNLDRNRTSDGDALSTCASTSRES